MMKGCYTIFLNGRIQRNQNAKFMNILQMKEFHPVLIEKAVRKFIGHRMSAATGKNIGYENEWPRGIILEQDTSR